MSVHTPVVRCGWRCFDGNTSTWHRRPRSPCSFAAVAFAAVTLTAAQGAALNLAASTGAASIAFAKVHPASKTQGSVCKHACRSKKVHTCCEHCAVFDKGRSHRSTAAGQDQRSLQQNRRPLRHDHRLRRIPQARTDEGPTALLASLEREDSSGTFRKVYDRVKVLSQILVELLAL